MRENSKKLKTTKYLKKNLEKEANDSCKIPKPR